MADERITASTSESTENEVGHLHRAEESGDTVQCPLCAGTGKLSRNEFFEKTGMKEPSLVAKLAADSAVADANNKLWGRYDTNLQARLSAETKQLEASIANLTADKKAKEAELAKLRGSIKESEEAARNAERALAQREFLEKLTQAQEELNKSRTLLLEEQMRVRELDAQRLSLNSELDKLRGSRMERAVSPSGGFDFERAVGEKLRERILAYNDIFESVGETVGLVARSKIGDHVQVIGPDSRAAGVKVVYECKRDNAYSLRRALEELDAARKNRGAEIGVLIVAASTLRENPRLQSEYQRALSRFENDIVVVWDAEDERSSVCLDAAIGLARALAVRSKAVDKPGADVDWDAVSKAFNSIEKQFDYWSDMNTWCDNISRDAGKLKDRLEKIKTQIERDLSRLNDQVEAMRGT